MESHFLVILSSILIFKLFKKDSNKILFNISGIYLGRGQYVILKKWSKPKGDTFSISLIQGNILSRQKMG